MSNVSGDDESDDGEEETYKAFFTARPKSSPAVKERIRSMMLLMLRLLVLKVCEAA